MRLVGIVLQYLLQCRRALWVPLVPILLGASAPTEHEVKLVYLYNFTKFVTWPDSAFSTPESSVNICVLGDIHNFYQRDFLKDRKVRNRPIALEFFEKLPEQSLCHVLFITKNYDRKQASTIIKHLATPTLVVGETTDFAKEEGIIGFLTDAQRRIRIEINLINAKEKNLTIRAQLLEIARVIYKDEVSS